MLSVAIDAGPLRGAQTGIGNSVAWTISAANERFDRTVDAAISLEPYVVSLRSRRSANEHRVPIPAAFALELWARRSRPRVDRWLGNPDVVHGTNYVVPPVRAARMVTVHDCWFLEHPDSNPELSAVAAVLHRSVADGAHVLTCSDATSRRVRELFDARSVETLYHGPPPLLTDVDAVEPDGGHSDAPFVLALGTVERRKNIPTLVAAFEQAAREHATLELRVAGRDGDDSAPVAAAIERLPASVRQRVVRHDQVTEGVKRWLFEHATVFAYPSLDEGFGIPILEAQQAGVPVAGSSAGSIPEVAGEGGLFCDPLDTDALANNLLSAATCDATRQRLISLGHINLERFSWRSTAEQLEHHYRRAAANV